MNDEPMDLVLNLRAEERWPELIRFIRNLPPHVRDEQRFQRQLALALNREGHSEEAERILMRWVDAETVEDKTFGILGRVYRDRWENALARDGAKAETYDLQRAIEMYSRGFEKSERRNSYPAINLLTLLEISNPHDSRIQGLADEIRHLLIPKLSEQSPDYFDYATQLELSIDLLEERPARNALVGALRAAVEKDHKADAHPRGAWALRTTAHNLRLLRAARERRGGSPHWAAEIEDDLTAAAATRAHPVALHQLSE